MGWNRRNDDAFYEDLCDRYLERIFLYCRKLVKGQEQFLDFVEDSTQNTFLEARKQVSKLKKHPNVEGWLYTTARNLINNSYRSMYTKKKHEISIDDHMPETWTQVDIELEEIFSSTIDLDNLCSEILAKLNEREYELYIDYYKNNMSISDLSQKHNVSATAMTTRIYRLKRKIKEIVHLYFEENGP